MLTELRIRNYAVIESLSVRLGPGLTVLTGETGAGKSIVVGALALLLGERASSEVVRPGADRATVEGVFETGADEVVASLLEEQGIEPEDGFVILRREVAAEGRNRAWVNGAAATAGTVGDIGGRLVDLHGQHEHQTLLRPEHQRALLDAFGGHSELADDVAAAWREHVEAAHALEWFDREQSRRAREAERLRTEAAEIESAKPRVGEEAELDAEERRLDNAEELAALAGELHRALYAAEDGVSGRLARLRRTLDRLVRLDPVLAPWQETLEGALYGLEEMGRAFGEYAAGVESDPHRLQELRQRRDLLVRLRAKYGPSLEEVVARGTAAREALASLEGAADERGAIEKRASAAEQKYSRAFSALSKRRATAAKRLAKEATAALQELGMEGGVLEVALLPLAEPGAHGAESVELRIAVNAGFEPRPLARVASGGELSRVMLALKSILAAHDRVPTLIFDEIDAGIGGAVAQRVASRLLEVASEHQVLVITHLPQIAARADHHLLVEKFEEDGITRTRLVELDGEARVRELARLLAGDAESETGLRHARELLAAGAR